jgi:hypothetical protein
MAFSIYTGGGLPDFVPFGSSGLAAFAQETANTALEYALSLGELTESLAPPVITPSFPTGPDAPAVSVPEPPTLGEVVWVAPNVPAAFTEVLETGDLEVEPFDDDPPTLNFGTAPAAFNAPIPTAPNVSLTFEDPELEVNLPAPPDLLSISVTPFDGLNMPTFDEDAPVLSIVEPTIREYTPGAGYTSALLTQLQTSLLERISGGGTGLGQDAETALWNRGREREARSAQDAIDKLEEMEGLGYAFPPGVYVDARLKVITETDYAERGHSREVMIESARLELENVKHALTTATQLEGMLVEQNNAVEQRLFEASRYATEAGVTIYNAKVQAFAATVDVYRAKVAAYAERVRAETARVDAYRAQIAAEEAKAQVNRALVDQYRAQIDAALSNIEIYKAEIAGIQAKAEIEKAKVQVFGEQVRAYTARVNAYTAGVEGFRATIQAEQSKQEAYRSRVEAFTAQVTAAARQIDARVEAYKGRIEANRVLWDGYRAQVEGEAARVRGLSDFNNAQAEAYRAEVSGASAFNDVLTKQWQAKLDQNQRTAEIAINTAKANAELYITTRSLALEGGKVSAQVAAQLGAAALNIINFSTSNSYSASESAAYAVSSSSSSSVSSSTSTSTNYNYSV